MFNLRKQVNTYSFSNGLVRGLKQVPFYLGSTTFLVLHGQSVELAMSQIFIYVFSLPKLLSFLLEVLGGIFSYKLGPRGSFASLFIGQFILAISYLLAALSFFMHTPHLFLILFSFTSFISQVGEALTSGAFEDCYERTIESTNCYTNVEEIEISKSMYIRLGQFSIAFFATFAVALYAKLTSPVYLSFAFLIGSLVIGYSAFLHVSWFAWAKGSFSTKEKDFPSIFPQIAFFMRSRHLAFIISTGILYFIYIKFVTLGPLLSTNFLREVSLSSLSFSSSLSVIFSSILIPLAGFFASRYISKNNRNLILKSISYKKATLLIFFWLTSLSVIAYFYPLPLSYNLLAIFYLSFSFTPIYIWVEWLRISLCEKAIQDGAPVGQNKSLFYSIISGSRELVVGLVAITYSKLSSFQYVDKLQLLLIISLASVVLLFCWQTIDKKRAHS